MADITRLKSLMAEYKLDALVVTGLKNTIYLSGDLFTDEVWHESPQGLCTSLFVIALPDKSFTVGSEFGVKLNVPGLSSTLHDCEMIVEVKQRVLAEQLKKRGFQNARIGLDMGETSADTLRALEKYLPNANFVCAESLLMRLRAVRTPEEIEETKKAIWIAEQAFEDARNIIQEGIPWLEVGRAWGKAVLDRGGTPHVMHPVEFVCQNFRAPSPQINTNGIVRWPTHIERGVTTRVDFAVCYNGYYSDLKIPVCFGEPTPYAVATVKQHVERLLFMYEVVRPGKTKREVHEVLEKEFRNQEHPSWWLHGVGIDVHEEPRIGLNYPSAVDVKPEITFEEGNVLALEPSWLVEETTTLEVDGPRNLCQAHTRGILEL